MAGHVRELGEVDEQEVQKGNLFFEAGVSMIAFHFPLLKTFVLS